MEPFEIIGAMIAFTQAFIAIAVFWHSYWQKYIDRSTQRIIRIHEWGNDCIDALAEASEFCLLQIEDFPNNGSYTVAKRNLLRKLSALTDRGRLFYRNVGQHEYGLDKYPARRGYRPEILDPLVATYHSVCEADGTTDQESFERLYQWRGLFISLLQYEVDPSWLQNAQYSTHGHGAEAGIPVSARSEPPKWPKDRLPV